MQIVNKFKNSRGSMAVYVTIVVLSMLLILLALFFTSNSVRRNQLITAMKVKEIYEADNSKAGEIYNRISDSETPAATITVHSTAMMENEIINIDISQSDNTDLDLSKCRYVFTNTETSIGLDEQDYTGGNITTAIANIDFTTSTAGTYYLHLLTTDIRGNATETISAPMVVLSPDSQNYSTANSASNPYYTYTAPADGTYKLQVWGAQGGAYSSYATGGRRTDIQ